MSYGLGCWERISAIAAMLNPAIRVWAALICPHLPLPRFRVG